MKPTTDAGAFDLPANDVSAFPSFKTLPGLSDGFREGLSGGAFNPLAQKSIFMFINHNVKKPSLFFLTPDKRIGELVRTMSQKPELYVLRVGNQEMITQPDFLTAIPEDKIDWFKTLGK